MFYTLLTTAALIRFGIAGYAVQDDYSASGFFDMFDFFTDPDPTHGFGRQKFRSLIYLWS